MTVEYTFKIADKSDFDSIVEVGNALFDYAIKPNRLTEFLEDDRHILILAYVQTKVVGMASGFVYIHPDKDPTLFINEVAVLDELQGNGIGSAMVRHICRHAKSSGCVEAWVATESTNLPAKKAYLNAGGKESADAVSLFTYDFDSSSNE